MATSIDPNGNIVALVFALVLGFERGARRSLASFRRAYCSSTGVALAPSTFYGRFTPEFSELMKQLTTHAFEHMKEGTSRLQRTLAAFAKVFIADGSLVRLHPNLQDDYPSVSTITPRRVQSSAPRSMGPRAFLKFSASYPVPSMT